MTCHQFGCEIPSTGGIRTSVQPGRRWSRYCEGHLLEEIQRRIAAGVPFSVAPWQILEGEAAA